MTKRRWAILGALYILLLACSHAWIKRSTTPAAIPPSVRTAQVARVDKQGPVEGEPVRIAYDHQARTHPDAQPSIPLILLHGSPGSRTNFESMMPDLVTRTRDVYAPDLPGFGLSTTDIPDYSIRAHARYVLELMDQLGIERAHIVGWSMGGGVALNIADIAPDRVESLTMLASIGPQETEGSGSYLFEHAKYGVGYVFLRVVPNLIPHFGLLGDGRASQSFLRNFLDSDQRPLRAIMEHLETPVLILHGRHDPLVADWTAERHHELIPTSRLVMTSFSHFMPFAHPGEASAYINAFCDRHETRGVPPRTDTLDLDPRPNRGFYTRFIDAPIHTPWWLLILIIALLSFCRPDTTTALAGLFLGAFRLDFGIATAGLWLGTLIRPRTPFDRCPFRHRLGQFFWAPLGLAIAQAASEIDPYRTMGWVSVAVWIVSVALLLNIIRSVLSRGGRRRLLTTLKRISHHEWWPSWVLYLPLAPWIALLALRYKGLLTCTAVNPGVPNGGGLAGESKSFILDALGGDPRVLPHAFIPAGPGAPVRTQQALEAIRTRPMLGGMPIIAKPDAGERGAGVRLIRTEAQLRAFFEQTPEDVIIQRYHPGPNECGIFWIRSDTSNAPGTAGRIFALTRKTFATVKGDGKRTLRELILRDRRLRCQARVFFDRHRDTLSDVPPRGEMIRLVQAGNHAQGCMFTDGMDLVTPELEHAIDVIASQYRESGFDFGRFDLRYGSDDALRRGEGFAIIELNGLTSEATSIYDPGMSTRRAYSILFRQWEHLFRLGDWRRTKGSKPLTLRELLALVGASSTRHRQTAD